MRCTDCGNNQNFPDCDNGVVCDRGYVCADCWELDIWHQGERHGYAIGFYGALIVFLVATLIAMVLL
jgi:hypothetical protein